MTTRSMGFRRVRGCRRLDSVEEQNGETHYLVKLVPTGQITSTGKVLEMRSGMTAQIDIIAGKRSVLAYLSSPITKTLTSALPKSRSSL